MLKEVEEDEAQNILQGDWKEGDANSPFHPQEVLTLKSAIMRRTGLRREVGQKAEKLCQFRITY